MDTLEVSNLNRQILFRDEDVGQYKADVAARRINMMFKRKGVHVTSHVGKLQDFSAEFFTQFNCVIAGLDNIEARSWLNNVLCSLVQFVSGPDGCMEADPSTIIPLIDGGTEGFLGHCRIILPTSTACFECTIGSFASNMNVPLCTIIDRPRVAEHCIQYALLVRWPAEKPGTTPDFDNIADTEWLFREAEKRADEYSIQGLTYSHTLGVLKRIVPAISSTNQIIGALSTNEAIKIMTGMYPLTCSFYIFDGHHGTSLTGLSLDKNPNCAACSEKVLVGIKLTAALDSTLGNFLEVEVPKVLQVENPTISTNDGILYCHFPESLRMVHAPKLDKTFAQLQEDILIPSGKHVIFFVDGQGLEVRQKLWVQFV